MRVQLISQQSASFEVPSCNCQSILRNTLNLRLYERRKWYGGWYDRQPYQCTCHPERRPSSSKRRDWVAERACYAQDKGPYLSLAFPALITRQHCFGYGPHMGVRGQPDDFLWQAHCLGLSPDSQSHTSRPNPTEWDARHAAR